jgi:CheY-like chemotaxis protein
LILLSCHKRGVTFGWNWSLTIFFNRHELRSPLHGILAASEFLAEQIASESPRSLLDTICACSQTLLDTFEQILDFTKINSFQKKRRDHSIGSYEDRGVAKSHALPESLHILKVTDIVAVVEDVVESIAFGATHYKRGLFDDPNSAPSEHVDVSIEVAPGDWVFILERGALRRIVMNIFSNALKYTEKGSISVRIEILKGTKGPGNAKLENCNTLVLTISDTGRGISNEYLRSDLFTAFSQEDPLAPGTGLGMSIVQNILRYLGGNIKIKSQMGMGTIAEISIPLTCPKSEREKSHMIPHEPSVQSTADDLQSLKREIKGKTVSFFPFEVTSQKVQPSISTIKKYLTEWYGVHLQPLTSNAPADLIVIDESQISRMQSTLPSKMLLICQSAQPSKAKIQHLEQLCERVDWICLPCGPYKLARAIRRCLQGNSVWLPPQAFDNSTSNNFPDIDNQTNSPAVHLTGAKLPIANPVQPSATTEILPLTSTANTTDTTQSHLQPQLKSQPEKEITLARTIVDTDATSEGLRILLVEDNPINMALLRRLVKQCHPSICHAAVDGQKAVEAVKKLPEGYHLIFMGKSLTYCIHEPYPIPRRD